MATEWVLYILLRLYSNGEYILMAWGLKLIRYLSIFTVEQFISKGFIHMSTSEIGK